MRKITMIPGDIILGQLRANLQLFMLETYNIKPDHDMDIAILQEIVYWICEESIAEKVRWMSAGPARESYLNTVTLLVREFDPEFGDKLSADLDAKVLNVTRVGVERLIKKLDIKPYDIWSIRRDFRYRDIYISYDGDYRIEEYNRLLAEGVITE